MRLHLIESEQLALRVGDLGVEFGGLDGGFCLALHPVNVRHRPGELSFHVSKFGADPIQIDADYDFAVSNLSCHNYLLRLLSLGTA